MPQFRIKSRDISLAQLPYNIAIHTHTSLIIAYDEVQWLVSYEPKMVMCTLTQKENKKSRIN